MIAIRIMNKVEKLTPNRKPIKNVNNADIVPPKTWSADAAEFALSYILARYVEQSTNFQ